MLWLKSLFITPSCNRKSAVSEPFKIHELSLLHFLLISYKLQFEVSDVTFLIKFCFLTWLVCFPLCLHLLSLILCVVHLYFNSRQRNIVFLLSQTHFSSHTWSCTRARESEPRVIPKNVIIGNEGEKRKIFFLNLTTNKTRSTASNDWLKRDGDVEVYRGGAWGKDCFITRCAQKGNYCLERRC